MPNDSFAWTPFRSHAKKVRYKKEREKRIKRNTVFHLGKYVNEPSGAVYDPNQEVMWSVGDSGDLILGRTNIKSQTTIKVPIKGNIARDREELVMDKQGYLWVLSIGDNKRNRKNVEINQLDPNQYYTDGKLDVIKKIKFTYPYGAIDVEGAFIFENKLYFFEATDPEAPNSGAGVRRQIAKEVKYLAQGGAEKVLNRTEGFFFQVWLREPAKLDLLDVKIDACITTSKIFLKI